MKKSNTLLLSSIFLASTIFPATVSATTVEKNETEWITIAEDTATDSVSHSTNKKSANVYQIKLPKVKKEKNFQVIAFPAPFDNSAKFEEVNFRGYSSIRTLIQP
ncbi:MULTISPECIES: hypothetical protein [Bacillus]|uniref:Uncharacterized protein n=1 Tax=Bacillus aerius TaxID=293388 RepID=A0AB39J411_9BACI|nr:hypothetical protein [Bacillus altitudinis]WOI42506.1 hypothetical protein RZ534_06225 [Bacillus altitudinis]